MQTLASFLARHGVLQAQCHVEAAPERIGEAMLSRAADWGTDLIVMGAYGHARWAQRMLGGATRSVLQAMTVPVLMTH